MPKQYKTAQVAKIIGVHHNTVRLYEDCAFITKPQRLENGYRVFTDLHIAQLRLARTALQIEVLQSGLRKQMIGIIKLSAQCKWEDAMTVTVDYMNKVRLERKNAEEALAITKGLLLGITEKLPELALDRSQTAQHLGVTIDTLRNWELNGLLQVKRKQNGYRIYTEEDIQRLKIIRSLRCANYSLFAILRMLNALSSNKAVDIREAIDTPNADEDITTACDKLLTSLDDSHSNAKQMLNQLKAMADSGQISILGISPLTDRKKLFEQVGVQFQETNYQEQITVAELCQVTASLYGKAANPLELLTRFGIADKQKSLVKELSGGQRQRLFIVLALIPNPEVVFLDELTTGLDAKARRDVWNILLALKEKGLTILLTSHFMDEVEALCDQICILKSGKIIFYGTVAEAVEGSPYDKFEDTYLWYTDEEEHADENL